MKFFRKHVVAVIAASILILLGVFAGAYWIISAEDASTFSDIHKIPHNRVGLVLGCAQTVPNGRPNRFFGLRIRAAHELFRNGKIDFILVSGDNHRKGYDEPTDMKNALISLGVPENKIVCDYAGFTTLDSIVRARKVFQLERFTIVSQRFHNQRALFIAKANGITAIAYNASDVHGRRALRTRFREIFSRVRAVADAWILHRSPHFLGDPIFIGKATTTGSRA